MTFVGYLVLAAIAAPSAEQQQEENDEEQDFAVATFSTKKTHNTPSLN
jgi:hypothetical protein